MRECPQDHERKTAGPRVGDWMMPPRHSVPLQLQLAHVLRHAYDAAHGDADDLVVLGDALREVGSLWGDEPVGEFVAPCGCNYDVMGDGNSELSVRCDSHAGKDER
jgi:hypothetical protein